MANKAFFVLTLVGLVFCLAHCAQGQACAVDVRQMLRTSWMSGGQNFSLWDVALVNTGVQNIINIRLRFIPGANAQITDIWEVANVGPNVYELPAWRQQASIPVGGTHTFGYIISDRNAAQIIVENIQCGGPLASPPPSPSASPSRLPSPSASPSRPPPPSATPTPPVGQPGCSVDVRQVARPSGQSGNWVVGNRFFQIYDLFITNTGTRPIVGLRVRADFAPNVRTDEWWNLSLVGASGQQTTWDVVLFGPRQPGTTFNQVAGYVANSPVNGAQPVPDLSVVSVTCS